ncbi:hypothetical protein [Facklamia sp. P9177]|uniref:hypothetical protein n=1 Tax=Facklamia sp. P9177 TaxID=3421945 RepID=UPI003D171FFD
MSHNSIHNNQTQFALLKQLLYHQHYQTMLKFLEDNPSWESQELSKLLQLGHAYIHTDLKTIEELSGQVEMDYLTKPSLLERRVYSSIPGLALELEIKEDDDYFRAITPLLVDVLRLTLENTVFPDLERYLVEVMKETDEGIPIYRGLQWNQSLIEADKNGKINRTWERYYGKHFNYSHYVSSSHLLKLVEDYVKDPKILKLAVQIRHIEKYARNIVAHELIYVDDAWLKHRLKIEAKEVHQQIINMINAAGLRDPQQWQGLASIQAAIEKELEKNYTKMSK